MRHSFHPRRTLASAAVGALALSLIPAGAAFGAVEVVCEGAQEDVFDDVPTEATHAASIDCIAAYGITEGVGEGMFAPDEEVPRDQMATFLVGLVEMAQAEELPVPEEEFFTDIADSVHTENIRIAGDLGITEGVSESMYDPNVPVTRGQIATFVAESLRSLGVETVDVAEDFFTDDESSVHEENINVLADLGIVTGVTEDEYNPSETLSRAQMATILVQAAGYLEELELWLSDLTDGETDENITADPADTTALGVGATQDVTFSGVTPDAVDVGLADCADVTVAEGRTVTFADADEDDAYAFDDVAAADITTLDETDVTDGDFFNDVDATDDEVVVGVQGAEAGCAVPIAFEDADDDDALDLDTADEPTEVFGFGGDLEVS